MRICLILGFGEAPQLSKAGVSNLNEPWSTADTVIFIAQVVQKANQQENTHKYFNKQQTNPP